MRREIPAQLSLSRLRAVANHSAITAVAVSRVSSRSDFPNGFEGGFLCTKRPELRRRSSDCTILGIRWIPHSYFSLPALSPCARFAICEAYSAEYSGGTACSGRGE